MDGTARRWGAAIAGLGLVALVGGCGGAIGGDQAAMADGRLLQDRGARPRTDATAPDETTTDTASAMGHDVTMVK